MEVTIKQKKQVVPQFEVGDVIELDGGRGNGDGMRLITQRGLATFMAIDLKSGKSAFESTSLQDLRAFYSDMKYRVLTISQIVLEEKQ